MLGFFTKKINLLVFFSKEFREFSLCKIAKIPGILEEKKLAKNSGNCCIKKLRSEFFGNFWTKNGLISLTKGGLPWILMQGLC